MRNIKRDRQFKSMEPWEQAYNNKNPQKIYKNNADPRENERILGIKPKSMKIGLRR